MIWRAPDAGSGTAKLGLGAKAELRARRTVGV
jgi:hypothetical protein